MELQRISSWLRQQRSATRLAYVLQLCFRILSSFSSLVWIRLLKTAMGAELLGTCFTFLKISSLGGLGDLGMGGIVGMRTGEFLGQKREKELEKFLASARSVFLLMAVIVGGIFLLLSPWLPIWFKFKPAFGTGSLTLLFSVGGVAVAAMIVSSYFANLNYACGNVTWPVIPVFLLGQGAFLGQWLLARQHQPLWLQYVPSIGTAAAAIWLYRLYIRLSNPPLSSVMPLKFHWQSIAGLAGGSFWVYLCTISNAIYRQTDGLVINAGAGPATVTFYDCNYKFCDMVVFLTLTAGFVSLPKITRWLASPDPEDQVRVRTETRRLNQFQTFLGCAAALAYLALNDLFMKIWWAHDPHPIPPAPLLLQLAFALNMAVTSGGDTGTQLSMRQGKNGLRFIGILVGLTGLLNVGLSIVAMKLGLLWGVAMATVVAQSLASLGAIFYACHHMRIPWLPWALRGWLLPATTVFLAALLRYEMSPYSTQNSGLLSHSLLLGTAYVVLLVNAAWAIGITPGAVKQEVKILRSMIGK